ncbi:MAG: HAD-IIIA family hydrolase [Selenomonadaceae bacterium]|nr:HAD-IIIA family hydrolase [Selenomonadaceae bacterium]
MINRHKLIVFDLDGTLINSLPDISAAANKMLAVYGRPAHSVEEYKYFVGNGSKKLVERILPDFSPEQQDEALDIYKDIYQNNLVVNTASYPGISDLLKALKAEGIKIAVCTNKHFSAVHEILGKVFPDIEFDAVAGERAGIPKKPDPANVKNIMSELGLDKAHTVYVGDSDVDMETGCRAGVMTIGVLWGYRPLENMIQNGGRIFISNPMSLLEIV